MVTYSTGLRTELQVTGENSGTWGTITNNNFSQVFEFAIAGVYAVPALTTGTGITLTMPTDPIPRPTTKPDKIHYFSQGLFRQLRQFNFQKLKKLTDFIIILVVVPLSLPD